MASFHSLTTTWPKVPEWTELAWPWSPAALHFLGAFSKPPVSRLCSCLLGHCRLIHLTSLWFTICSSWPLHSPLVLEPCFCNTYKPMAAGSTSAASLVSSQPPQQAPCPLPSSLSPSRIHIHKAASLRNPMGSYPRHMGKGRAGWDLTNGNLILCSKSPYVWWNYETRGPDCRVHKVWMLHLTLQHGAGNSTFLFQVTILGELKTLKHSGFLS